MPVIKKKHQIKKKHRRKTIEKFPPDWAVQQHPIDDLQLFKEKASTQEAKQALESIKNFLWAHEDLLLEPRKDVKDLSRLRKLADELNDIPTLKGKLMVRVLQDGSFNVHPTSGPPDERAKQFGLTPPDLYNIVKAIEQLKILLQNHWWGIRIGVCHLDSCQRFYIKRRRDEKYCSRKHGNTAAVRRKRANERRKRKKSV
ncbi:CGNR zinc finger domain-containing protein [Candidatus Acetothermia bacterium]|nr:CGNR zinc finger domain-containing protein [Candidatus Acetothermia bacterium]